MHVLDFNAVLLHASCRNRSYCENTDQRKPRCHWASPAQVSDHTHDGFADRNLDRPPRWKEGKDGNVHRVVQLLWVIAAFWLRIGKVGPIIMRHTKYVY